MLGEPEQMREAGLEPGPFVGIGDARLEHCAQLHERFCRRVLLGDERAHPHHLGEGPVGDAVAVGEAAAPVPEHRVRDAVEVLLELPGEPRLADAGDADDRDEVRLALLRRAVEMLLHEP
jgi:hypothetical protein